MPTNRLRERIEDIYLAFLLSYTKFFNAFIVFQMIILSAYVYLFSIHQDLLQTSSYAWALTRPGMGFGSYTLISLAALAGMGMWFYNSSKGALIVGIGCFTWIQMMFGISILVLTLSGVSSAITGTIQWVSIPVINVILLMSSGIPPSSHSHTDQGGYL